MNQRITPQPGGHELLMLALERIVPYQVGDPITVEDVTRIFELSDDGVRNYFITLGYWDLSRMMVAYTHRMCGDDPADPGTLRKTADDWIDKLRVASDYTTPFVPFADPPFVPFAPNANFCTYGIWSSLTVGRNVRNILLPQRVDGLRPQVLREGLTKLAIEARKTNRSRLSTLLGLGQRVVFYEIGRAIFTLMGLPSGLGEGQVRAAIAALPLKSAEDMGDPDKHLLERAMASYYLAAQEPPAAMTKRRAELMLRANLEVGSYEQQRLQQVLDYPLDDFPVEFFSKQFGIEDSVRRGAGRLRRRLNSTASRQVTGVLHELWGRFATEQLMTLQIGDELIRLGKDLPLPSDTDAIFPEQLQQIEDPALQDLFLRYDHSFGDGLGTGVAIWSNYDDRMSFIVNFMRSRAQYGGLHVRPFTPVEEKRVRRGQDPLP